MNKQFKIRLAFNLNEDWTRRLIKKYYKMSIENQLPKYHLRSEFNTALDYNITSSFDLLVMESMINLMPEMNVPSELHSNINSGIRAVLRLKILKNITKIKPNLTNN